MSFKTLILVVLVISAFATQYQTKSNVTNRYTHIYFPATQATFIQGEFFSVDIIQAPKPYPISSKGSIDLCDDTRKKLMEEQPELWNNSAIVNPCRQYFCGTSPSKWYPENGTYVQIENIDYMLDNTDVFHTQVQQYCTKCHDSFAERFDLVIEDETRNTACKWYKKDLCKDWCPDNTPCFFFSSRTSMCYSSDNIYMTKTDGFHYYFLRLRLWGLAYIYFVANSILFVLNIIFVIVPELFFLKKVLQSHATTWGKVKTVFQLRNQTIFIEFISNLMYIIAAIIDIANFQVSNATSIVLFIHMAGLIYSWSLLVILWTHIRNQHKILGLMINSAHTWWVLGQLSLELA